MQGLVRVTERNPLQETGYVSLARSIACNYDIGNGVYKRAIYYSITLASKAAIFNVKFIYLRIAYHRV